MNAFDPVEAVRVLERHRVSFVAVGSFAAWIHGAPHLTAVLEICTDDSAENRQALASALTDLDAVVLSDEVPVYETNAGALAVQNCASPSYADLARNATSFEIADGVSLTVASVRDLRSMNVPGLD